MRTVSENLERLSEFAGLTRGWNGYDAESLDVKVIERAKMIIHRLKEQPEVYPTANSSIQLEYELSNGGYLEFEIFENRIEEFLHTSTCKQEKQLVSIAELLSEVERNVV